jgi:hypothetical protein
VTLPGLLSFEVTIISADRLPDHESAICRIGAVIEPEKRVFVSSPARSTVAAGNC